MAGVSDEVPPIKNARGCGLSVEIGSYDMWFAQTHIPGDEDIQRAFEIAYIVHPEKLVALCVTKEGLERIHSIRALEDDRPDSNRPFKMKTPEVALPQIGVYYASDAWERDQESASSDKEPAYKPTANDRKVRYIKFLIGETMHRHAGNVAIGIGSLLYTYSTSDICHLSPDLFDSDNVRRDKARLVGKIKKRFSQLAPAEDQTRSLRFKCPDDSERELVKESLRSLAPWVQSHPTSTNEHTNYLTTHFGPGLPPLDWERNHILIDTKCCGFACLIGEYNKGRNAMKLDDPADKLLLPAFEGDAPNENDRFSPPPLTDSDKYLIRESFKQNLSRKRVFASGRIRVRVDGREHGHFWSDVGESQSFRVPSDASYIEVLGEDAFGDLLLALFPLSSLEDVESGQSVALRLKAEGGQKIQCLLSQAPTGEEETDVLAQIKYLPPETSFVRRWNNCPATITAGWEMLGRWRRIFGFAFSILAIVLLWLWANRQHEEKPVIASGPEKVIDLPAERNDSPPILLATSKVRGNHRPSIEASKEARERDERARAEAERAAEEERLRYEAEHAKAEAERIAHAAEKERLRREQALAEEEAARRKIESAKAEIIMARQELDEMKRDRDMVQRRLNAISSRPTEEVISEPAHQAQFPAHKKVKVEGVIVKRNPDSFVMSVPRDGKIVVSLRGVLEVTERKINPFRSARKYSITILSRGAVVEVEGRGDEMNVLAAEKIKMSDTAVVVVKLRENLAVKNERVDEAKRRLEQAEANARLLGGQIE